MFNQTTGARLREDLSCAPYPIRAESALRSRRNQRTPIDGATRHRSRGRFRRTTENPGSLIRRLHATVTPWTSVTP